MAASCLPASLHRLTHRRFEAPSCRLLPPNYYVVSRLTAGLALLFAVVAVVLLVRDKRPEPGPVVLASAKADPDCKEYPTRTRCVDESRNAHAAVTSLRPATTGMGM